MSCHRNAARSQPAMLTYLTAHHMGPDHGERSEAELQCDAHILHDHDVDVKHQSDLQLTAVLGCCKQIRERLSDSLLVREQVQALSLGSRVSLLTRSGTLWSDVWCLASAFIWGHLLQQRAR